MSQQPQLPNANGTPVAGSMPVSLNPNPAQQQPQQILLQGSSGGVLNTTTMIQLPSTSITSMVAAPATPTAPNTTTFILNPSNPLQIQQPQAGQSSTLQPINTSAINQMIAASPLISGGQQPQQPVTSGARFTLVTNQNQTNSTQMTVKVEDQPQTQPRTVTTNGSGPQLEPKTETPAAPPPPLTNGDTKPPTYRPIVPLDKTRLQELVAEVDPNEQLEDEVEDVLLSIADDFLESIVSTGCMIAKHRKSNILEVKDVQLALEKNWNMWIPGFGVDGVIGVYSGTTGSGQGTGAAANAAVNAKPKKCFTTEAHKQRMALIKKAVKKF